MAHSALALLVLESAAITLICVRGSIFAWLRERGPSWWRELSSCAMCAGFWAGASWHALNTYATLDAMRSFGAGALTSAAALLLVRVLDALEAMAE